MIRLLFLCCALTLSTMLAATGEVEYDEPPTMEDLAAYARYVARIESFSQPNMCMADPDYLFQRDNYCYSAYHNYQQSQRVFEIINRKRPSTITFDQAKLTNFDEGGTCSAMAFDFLARYLTKCACVGNPRERRECIRQFKPHYRANLSTYCSRQAAYNAIKVDRQRHEVAPDEVRHHKMQSLANYHEITLTPVTDSISVDAVRNGSVDIVGMVNRLPDGAYFVRALYPSYNDKMEWFGHSMVLIKDRNVAVFYDNSVGAREVTGVVGKYVKDALLDWDIPIIRLYRATPSRGFSCSELCTETCGS